MTMPGRGPDRVRCPECGLPTVPDAEGLDYESSLCDTCYMLADEDEPGQEEDECPRCGGTGEEPGAPIDLENGEALCSDCYPPVPVPVPVPVPSPPNER